MVFLVVAPHSKSFSDLQNYGYLKKATLSLLGILNTGTFSAVHFSVKESREEKRITERGSDENFTSSNYLGSDKSMCDAEFVSDHSTF